MITRVARLMYSMSITGRFIAVLSTDFKALDVSE